LEDLRKKFHLLEGDRKVFYHASSMAKQRNREQIQQLQKENKELREQLKSRVSNLISLASTMLLFN
jgi:cell shape-determining protein MreC